MNIEEIRGKLEAAEERFEQAKAELLEAAQTNPAYAIEWKAGPVMIAQARYALSQDLLGENNEYDDDELATLVRDWKRHTLLRISLLVRTESKSTSTMSNVWADAQAQATLELLEALEA